MKKLFWQSETPSDPAFHLARCEFRQPRRVPPHTHDFSEITLVESGSGKKTLNGTAITVKRGDIFLIRPTDSHSFSAGKQGIGLANLTFHSHHAIEIEKRYFPDDLRHYCSTEKLPWSTHLDEESYIAVESLFTHLQDAPQSTFEIEWALMSLFAILQKPYVDLPLGQAPDWLRHACTQMHRLAHLAEGVPALFRLAGRSPGHTANELRKHAGCTPTGFVNRLRIDHAARLLCSTNKSVLETALDCGFESQGHFHRCFKARFGTTPLVYRKKNHSLIF